MLYLGGVDPLYEIPQLALEATPHAFPLQYLLATLHYRRDPSSFAPGGKTKVAEPNEKSGGLELASIDPTHAAKHSYVGIGTNVNVSTDAAENTRIPYIHIVIYKVIHVLEVPLSRAPKRGSRNAATFA